MPDFKSITNFNLILVFIVPGIIIIYVRSRFITGQMPSLKENILACLIVSLIYYTFIIPVIEKISSIEGPWVLLAVIWSFLILIGPFIFGVLIGYATQREWLGKIARKFGLNVVHVIPAAWDWKFSKVHRGGQFVMVTLSNDEKVAGFFGENSFASSESSERDLYIEEEYIVSESGVWEARHDRVGILVSAKDIKYVEFWDPYSEKA